MYTISEKAW